MRVVALGSDAFSVFALRGLRRVSPGLSISVWSPRSKTLRTNPLARYCEQHSLKFNYLERDAAEQPDYSEMLRFAHSEGSAAVLLVCSFGYMVPAAVIDAFSAAYVIHPSLLPLFRGAAPISAALLQGADKTAISIASLSKGSFDTGDIFHQRELPIPAHYVYSDLFDALGLLARDCVAEFFSEYGRLGAAGTPQGAGSSAPKLVPGENRISPRKEDAQTVLRKYRAFTGSTLKNVFCELEDGSDRLVFRKLQPISRKTPFFRGIDEERLLPAGLLFNAEGRFRRSLILKVARGFVEVADAVLTGNPALRFGLLRPQLLPPERWHAFLALQRRPALSAADAAQLARLARISLRLK